VGHREEGEGAAVMLISMQLPPRGEIEKYISFDKAVDGCEDILMARDII
jgi:hypothetical protein